MSFNFSSSRIQTSHNFFNFGSEAVIQPFSEFMDGPMLTCLTENEKKAVSQALSKKWKKQKALYFFQLLKFEKTKFFQFLLRGWDTVFLSFFVNHVDKVPTLNSENCCISASEPKLNKIRVPCFQKLKEIKCLYRVFHNNCDK